MFVGRPACEFSQSHFYPVTGIFTDGPAIPARQRVGPVGQCLRIPVWRSGRLCAMAGDVVLAKDLVGGIRPADLNGARSPTGIRTLDEAAERCVQKLAAAGWTS